MGRVYDCLCNLFFDCEEALTSFKFKNVYSILKYTCVDNVAEIEILLSIKSVYSFHNCITRRRSCPSFTACLNTRKTIEECTGAKEDGAEVTSNVDMIESKSPSTLTNDEKLHTFIKYQEYKINGKIGTPGQKNRVTFSSLIFQIKNGLKKGYSEHEICDAVIKSIAPYLALRTYLVGKYNLNLKTLSRIVRSHFKETNATSLFTKLSNSKQLPSESAEEFVVRLTSLGQKILFISREHNCGL